jgi:hypothetical protein
METQIETANAESAAYCQAQAKHLKVLAAVERRRKRKALLLRYALQWDRLAKKFKVLDLRGPISRFLGLSRR